MRACLPRVDTAILSPTNTRDGERENLRELEEEREQGNKGWGEAHEGLSPVVTWNLKLKWEEPPKPRGMSPRGTLRL